MRQFDPDVGEIIISYSCATPHANNNKNNSPKVIEIGE